MNFFFRSLIITDVSWNVSMFLSFYLQQCGSGRVIIFAMIKLFLKFKEGQQLSFSKCNWFDFSFSSYTNEMLETWPVCNKFL